MIGETHLKVCGLTRLEDARLAAEIGADFLGFILYPKSPRHLPLGTFSEFATELPRGPRRVAVMVEPSLEDLDWAQETGFDRFQIHARHDLSPATVRGWSDAVGPANLWLAPKRPPGAPFPEAWLDLADSFLIDTFHAEGFGGSGRTGDWAGFASLAKERPRKTWILAGGLGPDNVADALAKSGARYVDVNSGVESGPGLKSPEKLRTLAAVLQASAETRRSAG